MNPYRKSVLNNNGKTKRRPVEMIDIETGNVIETFESASAAERAGRGKQPTICNACRGMRGGMAYGFKWQYAIS